MSFAVLSTERNHVGSVNDDIGEKPDIDSTQVPTIPNAGEIESISGDGDIRAWMQCFGSFVLFFNSWGVINTFGRTTLCYPVQQF